MKVTMYKIIGGKIPFRYSFNCMSEAHAVTVCMDAHNRMGLIGRYYCETSTGHNFQVS